MNIDVLLEAMPKLNASDLHLKVGGPPHLRIDGELRPVEHPDITSEDLEQLVSEMMPAQKRVILSELGTVDFAYSIPNVSRFRVNVFHQRGETSVAIRSVKLHIPTFEELNLPVETL